MKNELIMKAMQDYLADNYPPEKRVASRGDQLMCERQAAAKCHWWMVIPQRTGFSLLSPKQKTGTVLCAC